MTSDEARRVRPRRLTARMRLTLSYTLFAVTAGTLSLAVVYVGMKYIPNYPLTSANPRYRSDAPARQQILDSLLTACGYALALLTAVGMVGGWFGELRLAPEPAGGLRAELTLPAR
ncbi:hypothetical protein VM98_22175 [Streptomyces rubellomurinus subsp. indigoferus]|uniref:Uncharacterized protein n=1 Tax=Streptomyces rubellomurinus (strain ATCC 31215) TaxID=359131 RepID=A0A0F2T899_STRR3|nr:hypothetical protein [Streptomyces rubellomurinus]KJS53945.1 hypothetical protein VM98_22175 [Streptomyces rubellomurinus subsp. indigoferus]KJS57952.1 hypothetical protein VM95_36440 [Streptomyces rubellomurinus]